MKLKTIIASALLCLACASVHAADFQKGLTAANKGDYATALQEWRPLADQGDATAQYNLGVMYFRGQGVPQDYAEAVKWYRKAAEQGVAIAQSNLGALYDIGLGVPQDMTLAYMLYNLAAAGGYHPAVEARDVMTKIMTPAQIKEGQALASYWPVGTPLPKSSKTGRASVKISEEKQSKPVAGNSGISEDGSCRPTGATIRCQSQCVNGNCIVTYENGCKVRVQVQPQYDPINNLWTYPAPAC